ncbi:hypothetical protein L7F22_034520 [Adiantum nelumboides]|nr:hypothetical protein [Adiantum nelumboides]
MQVYKDENEEDVKASTNLWPHALRTAEAKKVTSFTLRQAGDSIRETTGWTDPVDSLSVYAYIAKAQANEAFVEDKRKREDEAPETSKRQTRANTRSDGERMQKSTPIPEVQMEDASKDKKQSKEREPSYKLRSDIELATNLKKVFEERILNSKVEMTLRDILGIAKREFHEEIIDIIKRKRHVPVEQETNPANSQDILHEELEDLEEPRARMENDVVLEAKHAHFHEDEESDEVPRSHFLRSHWARATTETVVKIADFEEPILTLVDHGSEINLMSMTLYQKGKWPIEMDHGWRIRAANTQPGFLYGACANVKVTIGDVLDDGSAYARVRSKDGKKAVQFMTVCVNHARNKEGLRDHPLPKIQKDFKENRKFGELHKSEKQYVSHFQSEMQGCTVLDPNDVISGIFEEVSHIDTIADLEAIDVSSSNNDFIKVNSFDMYEVLSQFCEKCEDALEVQVETKYKTVTKKVRPQATPLPKGSDNVMEKASQQPTLRDSKKIGHKFTKETLDSLKIGSDALLTEVEIQCFKEMISTHGKAFSFEPHEIGCVDPKVVAPMVIFKDANVSNWHLPEEVQVWRG